MSAVLNRVILYVQDVGRLATFYREAFGLAMVEEIAEEWAVLDAGACQLALHRVGMPWRSETVAASEVGTNVKLVMTVDRPLVEVRAELVAKGVPMGNIKSYPPLTGALCDGRDPEGNVFQLAEPVPGRVRR